MRGYERDAHGEGWHDGLLMVLLAEALKRGSTDGRGRDQLLWRSPRLQTSRHPDRSRTPVEIVECTMAA